MGHRAASCWRTSIRSDHDPAPRTRPQRVDRARPLGVDPAQQAGALRPPPAHGPRGPPFPLPAAAAIFSAWQSAAGRGPSGARLAGPSGPAIPARPTRSRGRQPLYPAPRPPLTVGRKSPGFRSHFLRAPQSGRAGLAPATETREVEGPPALPVEGRRRPPRRRGVEGPVIARAAPQRGGRKEEPGPGPAPALRRTVAESKAQGWQLRRRGSRRPPWAQLVAEKAGTRTEEQGAALLSRRTAFPDSLELEPAPYRAKQLSAGAVPASEHTTGHTCLGGMQGKGSDK